ncbi:hypothetical protein F4777DRAFT_574217 [Nemania sp. FL0916]|nr:hypothetical protein F4777DRAFT_574217 [Nemania sp. FL0916]
MPSIAKTTLSISAALALVQFCPAPFLAAIGAAEAASLGAVAAGVSAASAVAGNVISAVKDRRDEPHLYQRQEQNEQAWKLCHQQLGSSSLHFSSPKKGNVLVEGMPPACMTLATVITGKYDAGNPVPMGSSSILFQNLSDDDIKEIQDALDAHPSKF